MRYILVILILSVSSSSYAQIRAAQYERPEMDYLYGSIITDGENGKGFSLGYVKSELTRFRFILDASLDYADMTSYWSNDIYEDYGLGMSIGAGFRFGFFGLDIEPRITSGIGKSSYTCTTQCGSQYYKRETSSGLKKGELGMSIIKFPYVVGIQYGSNYASEYIGLRLGYVLGSGKKKLTF